MTFEDRVEHIKRAEDEFRDKLAGLISANTPIALSDLFAVGAARRFLALSAGFRTLARERNFPSCAGLLRMQIDNAARMNALRMVPSMHHFCEALMKGAKFDKQKDADGTPLRDAHLIEVLSREYPWVTKVYQTTSGDIHLSMNAFYSASATIDDDDGKFDVYIGPDNPRHTDESYFEILDAFLAADQMSGTIVLGYFMARRDAIERVPGTN